MKTLRNGLGFSVAELLTTIGITSLIALGAMPAVRDIYARYQLAGTASQLAFEVTLARMQAVGQNRYVRLVLGAGSFSREISEDGVNYVADGGVTPLAAGFSITAGSTGLPSFNRSGLAPISTTLVVRHGTTGPAKMVSVNTLGRVNVP